MRLEYVNGDGMMAIGVYAINGASNQVEVSQFIQYLIAEQTQNETLSDVLGGKVNFNYPVLKDALINRVISDDPSGEVDAEQLVNPLYTSAEDIYFYASSEYMDICYKIGIVAVESLYQERAEDYFNAEVSKYLSELTFIRQE